MHCEINITERLLQALTSNERDFAKILLGKIEPNHHPEYENPLAEAFAKHFATDNNNETLHALALIAILYLSVLHCGFSTRLMRTSIGYLRDNISLPTFNCNHYEKLYEKLTSEDCIEFTLFKDIDKFAKINLTKIQIFDAFDFLSNGL